MKLTNLSFHLTVFHVQPLVLHLTGVLELHLSDLLIHYVGRVEFVGLLDLRKGGISFIELQLDFLKNNPGRAEQTARRGASLGLGVAIRRSGDSI